MAIKQNYLHKLLFGLFFLSFSHCSGDLLQSPLTDNIEKLSVSEVITDNTATDATLHFTTNLPANGSIQYGTASGSYTQTALAASTSTNHSVSLSNLASNTTYFGRAIASANGLADAYSSEFSFTTASTITVTELTVTTISTSSAMITWTTNVATTHSIEYGSVSGSYSNATVPSATAATSHSATLSSLSSNATYYYRVRNYHATLTDTTSSEYSFSITETNPTAAQKQRGIWLVGGLSGVTVNTAISELDLFDPVTGIWYPDVASIASGSYTPVSFAGIAGLNGKIYVIGGFDTLGNHKNIVQIYDIAANSWSSGAVMPGARANITAEVVYDKIYILGGTTNTASTAWVGSATTYQYTPSTDTWATLDNYAAARSNRTTYVYGNVIYHAGGKSAAATVVSEHDGYIVPTLYDNTGAYTSGTTEVVLAGARAGSASAIWQSTSGIVYTIFLGGYTTLTGVTTNFIIGGTMTPQNYNHWLAHPFTAANAWQGATVLPVAMGFGSAKVYNNTLYHFGGGITGGSPTNAYYSYDLTAGISGSWSSALTMPRARIGHSAVKAY